MYHNRNRIFLTLHVSNDVFHELVGLFLLLLRRDEVHVILLLSLHPFLVALRLHHQMFQYLIRRCVFLQLIEGCNVLYRQALRIFLLHDVKFCLKQQLFVHRFVYLFQGS